jgi:gliding motility-associated-like protein
VALSTFLLVGFSGYGQLPTVTIANSGNGLEGGILPGSFTVTVDPDILLVPGSVDVKYSVLLSSTATAGSDYTVLSGLVTVNYDNTGGFEAVTVDVQDDFLDEVDETVDVMIDDDPLNYVTGLPSSAMVTIVDNDTAGVTVSTISGNTTEVGGTADFTVVLNSQPTANVTIPFSSNDITEGTIAVPNVVFTAANWNVVQTVTVTGIDDAIVDGDMPYTIVTGNVTSTDAAYNALAAADVDDVAVINTDNDAAGIKISVITGNTTEAGGTGDFTVVLTSQPTGNVLIPLSSSDVSEGTLAVVNLVFTTLNWNIEQTVTVTGEDDAIVDGDIPYTIVTGNVTSTDAVYNALAAADVDDVAVINTDNDAAGVTVSTISGNTTEAGVTATFSVVLNSQPTANVTIPLSSNDITEGTIAVPNMVFTAANWNVAQTVTVTGEDDAIVDGDIPYTIVTGNVTSTDAAYDALTGAGVADVAVINTDNDAAGVTVSTISGNTTEAGVTATFSVVLNSQPTANVTIPLSSNDITEGTISVPNVVFTAANWNLAQTVTVTGEDDAIVDGDIPYTIVTGNVTSTDAAYDALTGAGVADVAVINTDDDSYTASITANDPTATEAGTTTGQFTVDLGATNTTGSAIVVNFNIATGGSNATNTTDYANIGTSVSIANGQSTGLITITPVDDGIAEGSETVILTLATGTGYTIAPAPNNTATVTIADNDTAGVSIDDVSVNEGDGTATFTVTLNGAVFLGTIVSYSTANNNALAGSDYIAETGTVAFLGLNGETRTITIDISEDVLVEGTETFFVNLTNASGFAQLGKSQGIGTIVDNDSYIATITATDPDAAENPLNSGSFTVGLNTTNSTGSPMVINYNVSGTATPDSDYIAFGSTVSIGNGQESASITVTPINDTEVEAGLETVIVTLASGSGYTVGAPNNATVNIDSEDRAGLSIDDVLVNEGDGTATFTVTLNGNVPLGATVTYSTANNTATAGTDYAANTGILTFSGSSGETETVTINIMEDAIAEGTETFYVNLTTPIGLIQIDKAQGIGTIADNDNCIEAPLINGTPTIFCEDFTQDLDAYTDTAIPAGFELIWSSSNDFSITGARLPTSIVNFAATFYGFLHNSGTNCTSPPLEVTLVRNEPPEILSTTPTTICGPGTADISATVTAGGSLFWYSSTADTLHLGEGTNFTTPNNTATTIYYVEASANGCTSERVAVTVTVADPVMAGTTTNASACNLAGGGPTTLDLDTTRAGGTAGVWSIVGTPPGTVTIGADNTVDFEGAVEGDYVFRFTTNTAVSPCVNESVDVTITVTTCTRDSDGDGIIDRDEVTLGLDPNNPDTDADGINDGVEVGPDVNNPIDTDSDGIIDALDSNILDSDNDGIVNQLDPANDNPCIPNISDACQIDLAIEKIVDKASVLVGREVVFTVTLTNLSQIMVTNIAVNDLVSPATGFQYVSSTVTKGTYNELAGVWQLDEVLANEVNTLTITAVVPEIGTYQNIAAMVDSFPDDSNATNNTASASVTVTPRSSDECGFLFNQISPNGDGINDTVYINCIGDYPNNTLEVYDRYGNEVFTANGYDNTWMGTGKNGDLPKGTYFYILDLGDGTEVRKGWIQIIR